MNDTPKQSPGPFTHKVSKKRVGVFEIDESSICDAKGDVLIAENYVSHYDCEGDFISLAPGDWHLFTAAPEMLEVLKKTKQVLESGQVWDRTEGIMMIDEVVAKAEGRQQ
jgi:hypothetical protein